MNVFRALSFTNALANSSVAVGDDPVTLHKFPGCTCCDAYADYQRDNGFRVEVIPTQELPQLKDEYGMTEELHGCHAALIEGHAFEGHIPVGSIRRVLADRPEVTGLSVPGMPAGSPGMTGPFEPPMPAWTIPSPDGERPRVRTRYHPAGVPALRLAGRAVLLAVALSLPIPAAAKAPVGGKLAVHDEPRSLAAIEFENEAGETLTLDDFRGRIVVLNLWATWCPPCRREMPSLARLQAALGGPDFRVVALSVDRAGMEVVQEFFAEVGVEHLSPYVDTSMRVLPRLDVVGLPTTLVVDAQGREIARAVGEADWATSEMLRYFRGLLADRK